MDSQMIFLLSLSAAILALVGALGKARWNWRRDVPPFGRATNVVEVLFQPSLYTERHAVPTVRLLALAGFSFLLVAIAALIYQLAVEIL